MFEVAHYCEQSSGHERTPRRLHRADR